MIPIHELIQMGGTMILTGVVVFLTTKHNIKNEFRDKIDSIKDEIHKINLHLKDLEHTDNTLNQGQEQINRQFQDMFQRMLSLIDQQKRK